ncbi:hypothetical protein OG895_36430 [Streptomyces sp. NBC_00201]|uniref:hypothetical protein n=1 Tax=unclassified Streptomyces TaxID=2593676 RepID=UPI002257F4D5|nr:MULTISPECIES: hypothetical protein [unclassified Streptomyces]MCX5250628.1 hypothetical protein [Streptomyces sp. NBC_00201]MCX5291443.1 hypothetical protein [Streptomyces sp. NBC_00183]
MSNKKNTEKAANSESKRDTKPVSGTLPSQHTQGAPADRHVCNHTPDNLCGDDSKSRPRTTRPGRLVAPPAPAGTPASSGTTTTTTQRERPENA